MNAIALLHRSFDDLHVALREDRAGVDPAWLWWQPAPGLNHIGFLWWHLVRDEDTVLSYLAKEPELWTGEGWNERFGLEAKDQGTGLDPSRLESFRYDWEGFAEYAEGVWARTLPILDRLTEGALEAPAWPGSDWNVAQQLVEGCLCHSWMHLGEIRSLMGLQGGSESDR